MQQHTRIRPELVRFALNECFAEERSTILQHIEECDSCRHELAEIQSAMFALCLSAVGPMPPGRTRTRLLAAIRQ